MTTEVIEAPFWVRLKSEVTPEKWARILAILPDLIVTIAAWKGGVGKTELSKELAFLFAAVLVDLDWDSGGMTRKWGYRHETRVNAPLLDAIETGRVPRPLSGGGVRADLVPSHPDFVDNQPPSDQMASHLEKWQAAWARPVAIDTHPGGVSSTLGAVSAARVVVVPVNLEVNMLRGVEQMMEELQGGYPMILIPNRIESAPETLVRWLERISATYKIPVGPPIYNHPYLKTRHKTMAVSAPGRSGLIPRRHEAFVDEIYNVAKAVILFAADPSEFASTASDAASGPNVAVGVNDSATTDKERV